MANKTFASGYVLLAGKLIAFSVMSDGIVATVGGSPIECDPAMETFYTRGSVQSAILKSGTSNRVDYVAWRDVATGWRLKARDLYGLIAHMALNGGRDSVKARASATDLIVKVATAYAPAAGAGVTAPAAAQAA